MGASRLRLHPHEELVAADGTRPHQMHQQLMMVMMGRPRLRPVSEVQPTLRRCRAPPSLRVRTLLQTGKQTRFLVAVRCPSRRTLLGQARPPAQPPAEWLQGIVTSGNLWTTDCPLGARLNSKFFAAWFTDHIVNEGCGGDGGIRSQRSAVVGVSFAVCIIERSASSVALRCGPALGCEHASLWCECSSFRAAFCNLSRSCPSHTQSRPPTLHPLL
jgi:precorrin-6x reductase